MRQDRMETSFGLTRSAKFATSPPESSKVAESPTVRLMRSDRRAGARRVIRFWFRGKP